MSFFAPSSVLSCGRGPVVVPRDAVDRDERGARLDQAAGQQGALAEGVPAVAVAEPRVLGGDVEGGGHAPAGEHVEGALRGRRRGRGASGPASRRSLSIASQHPAAVLQAVEREAAGQRQVPDPVLRVVRVGLDDERVRAAAEVGRVVEEVVGPAAEVRHGDVGRHARTRSGREPGHRRADRRPALDGVVGGVEGRAFEAGEHPVVALGVVARAVVDRPEDRELVHPLAPARAAARRTGRRGRSSDRAERAAEPAGGVGLRVPGLHVAGPAAEPEQDDAPLPTCPPTRPLGPEPERSGRVRPPRPSTPAWRKLRLVSPSQSRAPPPVILNIAPPPVLAGFHPCKILPTRPACQGHSTSAPPPMGRGGEADRSVSGA